MHRCRNSGGTRLLNASNKGAFLHCSRRPSLLLVILHLSSPSFTASHYLSPLHAILYRRSPSFGSIYHTSPLLTCHPLLLLANLCSSRSFAADCNLEDMQIKTRLQIFTDFWHLWWRILNQNSGLCQTRTSELLV